jgi:prepilin-type N-terminal cleavage/methylation domain-containing protein
MDRARRRRTDEGFTLIEVLVSVAIIGMVMASVTAFFVSSIRMTHRQGLQQAAAQLMIDGIERARTYRGPALVEGRQACSVAGGSPCPATVATGASGYLTAPAVNSAARMDKPAGTPPSLPVPVAPLAQGVPVPAGDPRYVQLDGITYTRNWYIETCRQPATGGACDQTAAHPVLFYRVVVAVTWNDRACPAGLCTEATSTLVSVATAEPLFTV